MKTKISVIITGATGMVGEGVLHECLIHPNVEAILVIGRKPCGFTDPKITEIIHNDFLDLTAIEPQLSGYDACFFCAGVSSIGKKEPAYTKISYDVTMSLAQMVSKINTEMVFCYVSGAGTDSTEKGRIMWARVKGRTENDLMKLPFRAVFAFRPAFMLPTPGLKNALSFYKYVTWLYPVVHPLFPNYFGTLKELGLAMIHCVFSGKASQVLEAKDIAEMAKNNIQ